VQDYDLAATLDSGQAFRWQPQAEGWAAVVCGRWVKLQQHADGIFAETAEPQTDWQWLAGYLQVQTNLDKILASFPDDAPMHSAVSACRGLRLLRQDPWECLASFILSSTKQIVQIRQIVASLCARYGTPVTAPPGEPPAFAFPAVEHLAAATEADLRACKMGFRAPYLLATARIIARGGIDLNRVAKLPLSDARAELTKLPGVGGKIADCVLLFAYGFQTAFPVDVWVNKALKELYFPRRRVSPKRLRRFANTHFGPNAGYAQQYFFHYMRTRQLKNLSP
jgi:N-glycosylase/DNA lyase